MFRERTEEHKIRSNLAQWTLTSRRAECLVTCLSSLVKTKEKSVLTTSQYLFMQMRHESPGCRDEPWFMTTSRKWLKISVSQDDSKCNKGISNDLVTNVAAQLHLIFQQIFPRSMKNDSCIIWTVNFFMLVDSTFCVKKRDKRKSKRGWK